MAYKLKIKKWISLFAILFFVMLISFSNSVFALEDNLEINLQVTGQTPTPVGGGGPIPNKTMPEALNLTIKVGTDFASISWETINPSLSKIFWGETYDYEKGSLAEIFFSKSHSTKITNLSPDSIYYFRIEITDHFENKNAVEEQIFKTLSLPDKEPPANVKDFTASPKEDYIKFQWGNPADGDFDSVRILRSKNFFPLDPLDGELVYEGQGEEFEDRSAEKETAYFYSIFSRDKNGNYSSGVVVSAKISDKIPGISPVEFPPESPFDQYPEALYTSPEIKKLSILDFDFIQRGKEISFAGSSVNIDGGENLKISLDYEKVPEVLKTIGITLRDPDDSGKTFSFLLRVNSGKTAYEAIIAPLEKSGQYLLEITILDYKNQGLKKIKGELLASIGVKGLSENAEENIFSSVFYQNFKGLIPLLILAVIALIILILVFNKKNEKNKKNE